MNNSIWNKAVFSIALIVLGCGISTCKRGPKLSHPLEVQLIMPAESTVYPLDNFQITDEYGSTSYVSPDYVYDYTSSKLIAEFKTNLTDILAKNNIILVDYATTYHLTITDLKMLESLDYENYIDSCSVVPVTRRVYYSNVTVMATAKLYYGSLLIGNWTQKGYGYERVRTKTDDCGEPKVKSIVCGPSCLVNRVAKEVRVRVAKELKDREG